MIIYFKILFVIFSHFQLALMDYTITQEAAKVEYTNPKYVRNVSTITYKANRRARYLTNVTVTTQQEWNNNVTFSAEVYDISKTPNKFFELSYKQCDAYDVKWISNLVRGHSELDSCPIPAGTYHFFNMDMDIQLVPFLRGLSQIKAVMKWSVTATKELIGAGSLRVRIVNDGKRNTKTKQRK